VIFDLSRPAANVSYFDKTLSVAIMLEEYIDMYIFIGTTCATYDCKNLSKMTKPVESVIVVPQ